MEMEEEKMAGYKTFDRKFEDKQQIVKSTKQIAARNL